MYLSFIFYAEANIVCLIIFGIMLMHDLQGVDRQEKHVKYDYALIAFMLYFISDTIWAAFLYGMLPKTMARVLAANLANAILMAIITYRWFCYALAVQNVPYRNKKSFRLYTALPLILSVTAAVIVYLIDPHIFYDADLELKPIYNVFQVGVPITYIIAELIFTIKKVANTDNLPEKRRLLSVGAFPLMVVVGGLIQVLSDSNSPIFCFSSTVLMLIFYIQSMESQISMDPLTGLNNRAQLFRYISQDNAMKREGRLTYVMMIDVNDFKSINDTYGHSSGDKALTIIANALKSSAGEAGMPGFIGRYGGDEFIIIAHPEESSAMSSFESIIRERIHTACAEAEVPFDISVGIGYDMLDADAGDSFEQCIERADKKLYTNKSDVKGKQ